MRDRVKTAPLSPRNLAFEDGESRQGRTSESEGIPPTSTITYVRLAGSKHPALLTTTRPGRDRYRAALPRVKPTGRVLSLLKLSRAAFCEPTFEAAAADSLRRVETEINPTAAVPASRRHFLASSATFPHLYTSFFAFLYIPSLFLLISGPLSAPAVSHTVTETKEL